MAFCVPGLTNDIVFDCNNKPIAGIENKVLLINWLDIDRSKTTWNSTKTRITHLELLSNKRAYLFEGRKRFFGGFFKVKDNGFEHGIYLKTYQMNDNTTYQINQIVKGGLYVAIVEVKAKGNNQIDAFEILGYDCGLQIIEGQRNYNDNDGVFSLEIGTPKHLIEPRSVYKWLQTDYATTLNLFNKKLSNNVL